VALADPGANSESLRAACQQLLQLGQQQERLIDALLTLASSQRGLRNREPFDLAEVTARVMDGRRQEAARLGVRVETRLAPAIATGDPSLAESLVANLVDNAIRHNVTRRSDPDHYRGTSRPSLLLNHQHRPLIPPGEVGRLLEPFQQLNGERTRRNGGHGLGLAIISAVASAHDASLTVRARPEGGLDIMVMFRA
jgi:signal transduction histidine kinase